MINGRWFLFIFPGFGRGGRAEVVHQLLFSDWPGHDGPGRRRGRAVAVRKSAAGPGGPRDPGTAPAPHRVADDKPGETRLHDVWNVQHLARVVADQTVEVAEQVTKTKRGCGPVVWTILYTVGVGLFRRGPVKNGTGRYII